MENNKPILKKGDNPSVVLHEFVKRTFKEEIKVEIVYIAQFCFDTEIKIRITLPCGVFWEEKGRNKKIAKRKAAKYIIENWDTLKKPEEWVPEEGYWSLNCNLCLQSNHFKIEQLINNNNCFISKPIAYWVADEIKKTLSKYKKEDNDWFPKKGDTYFFVSNLDHIISFVYKKDDNSGFYGYGEYHTNNRFKTEEIAQRFLEEARAILKMGRNLSTEAWKQGETCYEIDCLHKMAEDRANLKIMFKSMRRHG